jgi:hypothetical protein
MSIYFPNDCAHHNGAYAYELYQTNLNHATAGRPENYWYGPTSARSAMSTLPGWEHDLVNQTDDGSAGQSDCCRRMSVRTPPRGPSRPLQSECLPCLPPRLRTRPIYEASRTC